MLIPVGYQEHNKLCGTIPNCACPHCGKTVDLKKFRRKLTGYVIFVPVASKTLYAFLGCSECGHGFEVDKKAIKEISTPAQAADAIAAFKAEKQRKKEEFLAAGCSKKSQTVAALLAAFLTTYGAPFFYLGKPFLGIAFFAASCACLAAMFFPALIAVVLFGFFFAARICMGKVKDKEGKYIVSPAQWDAMTK